MASAPPAPRPGRLPGETLLGVWRRRLISIPLVLFLAAVGFLGSPLWLGLAAGRDLLAGRAGRGGRSRAVIFFLFYLGLEIFGLLGAAGCRLPGPRKLVR